MENIKFYLPEDQKLEIDRVVKIEINDNFYSWRFWYEDGTTYRTESEVDLEQLRRLTWGWVEETSRNNTVATYTKQQAS
jgi:hypothetical protein